MDKIIKLKFPLLLYLHCAVYLTSKYSKTVSDTCFMLNETIFKQEEISNL